MKLVFLTCAAGVELTVTHHLRGRGYEINSDFMRKESVFVKLMAGSMVCKSNNRGTMFGRADTVGCV